MNLQQALVQIRSTLDEITPNLWSNNELIFWYNEGVQRMCSAAQSLRCVWQRDTIPLQQEYVLPEDFDEADFVVFFQGTLLGQIPISKAAVSFGSRVGATPLYFYMKNYSQQTDNQVGGGNLQPVNITLGVSRKPRKIIGLWPTPSMALPLTIEYYAKHYWMNNLMDEPAIDDEYIRGAIEFAVANAKEKESGYTEAQVHYNKFGEYLQAYRDKCANNGQEVQMPRMKIRRDRHNQFGGSSWIYVGDAQGGEM